MSLNKRKWKLLKAENYINCGIRFDAKTTINEKSQFRRILNCFCKLNFPTSGQKDRLNLLTRNF